MSWRLPRYFEDENLGVHVARMSARPTPELPRPGSLMWSWRQMICIYLIIYTSGHLYSWYIIRGILFVVCIMYLWYIIIFVLVVFFLLDMFKGLLKPPENEGRWNLKKSYQSKRKNPTASKAPNFWGGERSHLHSARSSRTGTSASSSGSRQRLEAQFEEEVSWSDGFLVQNLGN